jgi:hypothetical protein
MPRQRVQKHRDYRTYYNDGLRELVETTWARELRLFGYDFDGHHPELASLTGHLADERRRRYVYLWAEDRLLVDGTEVPR